MHVYLAVLNDHAVYKSVLEVLKSISLIHSMLVLLTFIFVCAKDMQVVNKCFTLSEEIQCTSVIFRTRVGRMEIDAYM